MSEDIQQNMDNNKGYFEGKVIAKLESIEQFIHRSESDMAAVKAALLSKADKIDLDKHIAADMAEFGKVEDKIDGISGKVGWIVAVISVVAFIGQLMLSHYWK